VHVPPARHSVDAAQSWTSPPAQLPAAHVAVIVVRFAQQIAPPSQSSAFMHVRGDATPPLLLLDELDDDEPLSTTAPGDPPPPDDELLQAETKASPKAPTFKTRMGVAARMA